MRVQTVSLIMTMSRIRASVLNSGFRATKSGEMYPKLDDDLRERILLLPRYMRFLMFSQARLPRSWDGLGSHAVQNSEITACNERWREVPLDRRNETWNKFEEDWATETQKRAKVRLIIVCMVSAVHN